MLDESLDTNKLKLFQSQLNKNAEFLELLINTIPNPLFYKDKNGVYHHCNDTFAKTILGIPKELIIGKSLFDIPEYIPYNLAVIYKEKDEYLLSNPGTQIYQSDVQCSDGTIKRYEFHKATFLDEDNNVIGLVGIMLDVTETYKTHYVLKKKNLELREISYKDPLTNIYNRRMFDNLFLKILNNANSNENIFNFMILDIDNFKLYNDTYGYNKGDDLLISIAQTLQQPILRVEDYCFRLDGEKFALLYITHNLDLSEDIANRIKQKIENLHTTPSYKVKTSIGLISIKDNFRNTQEYLHKEADTLLYNAKKSTNSKLCKLVL